MIKGKLIGSGATADVFEWTENTVVKIFNDYEPDELIEQEVNNTKALENCSFKFPRVIKKLEYDGKRAIVYEKVVGISMLKQLEVKPSAYKKLAQKLAHLHFMVNGNHIDGIKDQNSYFKERISWAKDLTDDTKGKLYKLIDNMPAGNCLCHCDLHPDNVICSEDGDYIIDWADCCNGNPCADVARSILTLKTAPIPENTSIFMKAIIMFIRNRFCISYTKEYLKISGKTVEQIDEWQVVVAAYRLCGAKKTEKRGILNIINNYFV